MVIKMNSSEQRIWNNQIRRQRERKRNIILAFCTFCLILILSLTINSFLSNAKTNKEMTCKYYKSIMIEEGDTLWSIASQNLNDVNINITISAYIKEIMKMNGLQSDRITAGMYLVIPYYSSDNP
ncbi:MAG: LysM peptidoglycan-binding domain-containing protein [Lachnospiraceae bacterium]|nr:LysM peptidoglycan-binding domain-containing protein [Lachnospiraceae bacterium]